MEITRHKGTSYNVLLNHGETRKFHNEYVLDKNRPLNHKSNHDTFRSWLKSKKGRKSYQGDMLDEWRIVRLNLGLEKVIIWMAPS